MRTHLFAVAGTCGLIAGVLLFLSSQLSWHEVQTFANVTGLGEPPAPTPPPHAEGLVSSNLPFLALSAVSCVLSAGFAAARRPLLAALLAVSGIAFGSFLLVSEFNECCGLPGVLAGPVLVVISMALISSALILSITAMFDNPATSK